MNKGFYFFAATDKLNIFDCTVRIEIFRRSSIVFISLYNHTRRPPVSAGGAQRWGMQEWKIRRRKKKNPGCLDEIVFVVKELVVVAGFL
jgi:hypothetical protein